MKVLVACEFTGTVREAFKSLGHEAHSCDLLPSEIPSENHWQCDIRDFSNPKKTCPDFRYFDLLIAHPPCTFLSLAGNKWMLPEYRERFPNRLQQREDALDFVFWLMNLDLPRICVENPRSVISSRIRKPDQIIQPWQFGHTDRKATCLWLKGLPLLTSTKMVEPLVRRNRNGKSVSLHHDEALRLPADKRWKARSKTYQGIADAMANQWGVLK